MTHTHRTITLTETEADTLQSAMDSAVRALVLNEDERAAMRRLASAFRRSDVTLRVHLDNED